MEPTKTSAEGAKTRKNNENDEMHRDDSEFSALLGETRSIAVIGIKTRQEEDAYRVPLYMQRRGYRIIPVNPKEEEVLGETAYPNLAAIPDSEQPIDLINLFRAAEHLPGHVDEILALSERPRAVWMQLGIQHGTSAKRLREAGIRVVQDRCIMVEHRRLYPRD
jgi:predicted CoA-binding protein